MKDEIYIYPGDMEIVDALDYSEDIERHFSSVPEVVKHLIKSAKVTLSKIEKMLYSAPAFVNVVRSSIPAETFHAIFTDEQKSQIAQGALKLMTKKDGSLMANLVNTETKK